MEKYPQIKFFKKNFKITTKKIKKTLKVVEKYFSKINN